MASKPNGPTAGKSKGPTGPVTYRRDARDLKEDDPNKRQGRKVGPSSANAASSEWQDAPEGQVHSRVFSYLPMLESRQSSLFNRFPYLEALYDPNNPVAAAVLAGKQRDHVSENIVASSIDTLAGVIASVEVDPKVETDGADWGQQRTARHLEWYASGLMALLGVFDISNTGFRASAKKGTGLAKVTVDRNKRINVQALQPDDVIVDEQETQFGDTAKSLHHRQHNISKERLKAEYPAKASEIDGAGNFSNSNAQRRVRYPSEGITRCVVIESWYLPVGCKGDDYYRPGRHMKCIDGCDILDEEYTKDHFPIARMLWEPRAGGWYGISAAERIAGIQRALNRRNKQIERQLDQLAFPMRFVRINDANLAAKPMSDLGMVAVYKGEKPVTEFGPAVSGETYQSRQDLKSAGFEEVGLSRLQAQSQKPGGLDSGAALRAYRDQTSDRFNTQSKAYERFVLDIVLLILECCKELDKDAPVVMAPSKFGSRKIKWSQVDMGDLRIQLSAAATLPKSDAGRRQTILEWSQAGVISTDETRELLRHPDLESAMSLYTAALESVDWCLERIADGEVVMPEPFMNLKMIIWRSQQQYLRWQMNGAPEHILESCRQFGVQAAAMGAPPPAVNDNAMAGAAPPGPMPPPNVGPDISAPSSALAANAQYQVA